jgi:hypothetical protein
VLIGQNTVHVTEIFNIVIISHESLRNKRLVNSKSSLILEKFKIKMKKKSNISLVHAIKRSSALTHLSRYHNDRLWELRLQCKEGENSVDGSDVGTQFSLIVGANVAGMNVDNTTVQSEDELWKYCNKIG